MAADPNSSQEKQWLHILAVPYPAQSHMSVMMQLCRRLAADQRFHVAISFVNIDSIHEQMVKHWIPPKGLDIRLESIRFDWKIPKGFDAYCATKIGVFNDMAEQQFVPELLNLASRLAIETAPVSCIISDYFLPWTQAVADRLGVDRVALWSGYASWACIEYHIPQLVAKNHIFLTQDDVEDCWIDYIGGLAPMRRSDLPAYLQKGNDQLRKQQGIKQSKGIGRSSRVLVNSFYSLEPQAFDFMRDQLGDKFVPIGPLFLLDPENVILRTEDANCLPWLDSRKNKSVLYVSFGSIAVLTKKQFGELAAALESCGWSLLWVVRPELVIDQEDEEDDMFDSFRRSVEMNKDKGLLVSWAPQLQVLKHPAVGGFLTHCGWNSMLESIANGVPMVGWPWAGDQNTNCKFMVEDWNIGAGLSSSREGGVIQRDEIARAIKSVMEDESMRMRVEKLKSDCAAEAVRQANRNAEALIEELAAFKLKDNNTRYVPRH